jgi:hypothetical protein
MYSWFPVLAEPGFEQTVQFGGTVRQLPTDKWGCLVQSLRLLFEQCQMVQRPYGHIGTA